MVRIAVLSVVLASFAGLALSQGKKIDSTPDDVQRLNGLWSGSWGGGPRADGVVFQPVIAEAVIRENRIELQGFRTAQHLEGTFRLDVRRHELHVTPVAPEEQEPSPAKSIRFLYKINRDELTLTDDDNVSVSLTRERISNDPLANVAIELAVARGIDPSGDLLVTDQVVLRAGRGGDTYFAPRDRRIKVGAAARYLIQEVGWKKLTLEEARAPLGKGATVALAFRTENKNAGAGMHELWKEHGPVSPEADAALRTMARILRPGTVLFVLSVEENVPQP